ncbi:DUF3955 domain-containing protein [Pontibaca salina]|uniref:DUF3955 domain-containing protein n=1 Tax=Pontibaca salina TaxID=2795731 RepID=A0A934HIE1_9RHOB|nr:DUF3955 domain-containing protein [Pontibaca salina]MBI6628728.1 DUF3955 domain-containing protein [Pontibaca salina]
MYRKLLTFSIVTMMGMGCASAYASISTTVDAQGYLREPFYLIPLGYLFLCAGLGGIVITLLRGALARLVQPYTP